MRLAVSNIAWPPEQRHRAYDILARADIPGLEIAPGLFFAGVADPFAPTDAEVTVALTEVDAAGLSLVSMQSLLFGVTGAALFEGPEALAQLETGLIRAITLAGRLGIRNVVFGSPKQRVVPEGMDMRDALDRAAGVFARLGDCAHAAGTVIAMEANPAVYGTNFLTHAEAALAFVRHTGHPALQLILDMGTMHLNGVTDAVPALVAQAAPVLSHVHVSEPQMTPAPATPERAVPLLRALRAVDYDHAVSIEMRAAPESPLNALELAVARLVDADRRAATEKDPS
jgi:sugar phosphate isomerase/epimerase